MDLRPPTDTVKAPGAEFVGDVYVTPIVTATTPSRLVASLVRFTPTARTNWHSHAVGQALHITEGVGFVVNRDGTVLRVRAGDTVWTRPGEEHWHGGTAEQMMCHIAMLEVTDDGGNPTTWLEPVSDEDYQAANAH